MIPRLLSNFTQADRKDTTEYKIITAVIEKTFALQQIYDQGREPTEEELDELLTIPRPEKAND